MYRFSVQSYCEILLYESKNAINFNKNRLIKKTIKTLIVKLLTKKQVLMYLFVSTFNDGQYHFETFIGLHHVRLVSGDNDRLPGI